MARKKHNTPAIPVVVALQADDLVGSYRITRKIGEGGMGAVYEGEHIHLGTRAAIKVLLPELSANPEAIKRFVNEARAASELKHPRIVTVHECAQRPNGQWFIVMQFVEGGSLKRKMQSLGGPLGIGEVVAIIGGVASALDAAHDKKIIHRDIKPENIQLTASPTNPEDDTVTVLDFGIAKIDESRGGVGTRQGVALGTPNYMAPEYLRGDAIDHRVDVYALGVVAWEMLTGESLWSAGDQPTKIHEQQRTGARPLDPCAIKSHIPSALGAAVASALAFDPANRWPTVRAFALAVAHAVTSEWGETGMDTLRRVARELTIAPGQDSTAGRPMPPPLAKTIPVGIPIMPTPLPPGAVPIVTSADGVPTATHDVLPAHLPTPAPIPSGRPDAPTVRAGTLSLAVNVSQSPITVVEPIRAARQRRQRRALSIAIAASVGAVLLVVVIVVASSGSSNARGAAPPPTTAPATSAIAIVSEPAGATVHVDGTARGVAPINVAAPVGAEIEIRAELVGHAPTVQRAKVAAEPATVRVVLAPLAAPLAIDAGADAPPVAVDAGNRRRRPRDGKIDTGGGGIDPDGLVQP